MAQFTNFDPMDQLKRVLARAIHPIATRLGYSRMQRPAAKADPGGKQALLQHFWTLLKRSGFDPQHIVDIGANHGTWTREALKYFPNAAYTLIEPQADLRASVQDLLDSNPRIRFHAVGAGKEAGSFQFTLTERDDSRSFNFSAAEAQARGLQQITLPVVTLDALLAEEHLPMPDLLKIDAEGLDIEVLEGARSCFGRTEVILVEATVRNKRMSNTVLGTLAYMEQHGYVLFDITDMNRPFRSGVLWLLELAFVKKNGMFDRRDWISADQ